MANRILVKANISKPDDKVSILQETIDALTKEIQKLQSDNRKLSDKVMAAEDEKLAAIRKYENLKTKYEAYRKGLII